MDILIPVLLLSIIGVICAALLTVAAVCFDTGKDETLSAIRACLPGANCGACGYSGCDGYAAALASGETDKTNLCIPGADKTAADIAALLGTEAADVVEQVAYVACNGTCGQSHDTHKYEYMGTKTCRAAASVYGGDRFCTFACLGYGDCAKVCPKGAICIENGVAHVDPRKCIGCGICARECPHHIIHIVPDTVRVVVKCSSGDKGAAVRKACTNGCIGCGKCEKNCPEGAITVKNNLAVIDYDKCTGCGTCKEGCPVHCIHEGSFKCGAHFD